MTAAAAVVPFRRVAAVPRAEPHLSAGRSFVETAEGRRIAYLQAGAGPDVVLIHGTLMTADDMRLGPMPLLTGRFRCTAFDRPGHGWTDHHRGTDASLWSQMETLRGAVRALGLERPVICGHSFGGAVALAYALVHPDEIAGVVALAPICFPEPRLEHVIFAPRALPFAGDLLSGALGATLDPLLLPVLWRSMFLPQPMPESFAAAFPFRRAGHPDPILCEGENAMALWPDLTRSALSYATCRAPVRILQGTADIVVSGVFHAAPAAALIPGARLEWLSGIGHMLHHARPEIVDEAVAALLDR